ncbi:glycoside hydrolase family 68 protein [Terrilactibacillus laevilacticus]|uniref:Glycoside hydrolase family 68 protein n=1 Tax=Terrilactibacillus laevilacticus TaxID=1380157 RepID=A0ABW5PN44_9BACI|nr:glycoside hydrolase family 68 protein [Terrilactibacillus laevilacticus]
MSTYHTKYGKTKHDDDCGCYGSLKTPMRSSLRTSRNKHSHSKSSKLSDVRINQTFPITQSIPGSTPSISPIPGGAPNRNFPSAIGSGNQLTIFRTFTNKDIERFCNYNPVKDFNRCLSEHINAVPSNWTREQAEMIRITPENTTNVINEPFPRISPDVWIWDMWPLTEKDGSIAVLPGGWRVLFALTAPKSVLPGKRHDVARIGYFYSRNGVDWIEGGTVFPEGASPGSREWAGSAFVENGRVNFFYTATGRRGETQLTFEQRIVLATANVVSNLDGVIFTNFGPHRVILEPEGVLYQTLQQSQGGGIIYAFRDPFFFKDPATGCEYLLFEGNIGGLPGEINCGPGVPPEASLYTGNIGIALLRNNNYTEWQLLPALLQAPCVNQQTERPHMVVSGGRYYLFTDSHRFTFAPGLMPGPGPDGLYGFVASRLRGNYVPLNGSGLVVTNPPQEPFQAYSWLVLPDFTVLSFIDNFNLQGIPIEEVGLLPPEFQFAHFGGTLAPTLQLEVLGTRTRIVNELAFGLMTVSETESPKCPNKHLDRNKDYHNKKHHKKYDYDPKKSFKNKQKQKHRKKQQKQKKQHKKKQYSSI